ncbi:MAG: stage II sporulation protein P [Limnochordaceae bacterium]|nr:stage II sporulation protein P [Limnochordaceae bacterium]
MRGFRASRCPQAQRGGLAREVPRGPWRSPLAAPGLHLYPYPYRAHRLRLPAVLLMLAALLAGLLLGFLHRVGPPAFAPGVTAFSSWWAEGQQVAVRLFRRSTAPGPGVTAVPPGNGEDAQGLPAPTVWQRILTFPAAVAASTPEQAVLAAALPGFSVYLQQTTALGESAPVDTWGEPAPVRVALRGSTDGAGGEWPPPGAEALLPINPADLRYEKDYPAGPPGTSGGADAGVEPGAKANLPSVPAPAPAPVPPSQPDSFSEPPALSDTNNGRPVVLIYHTHSAESYHTPGRQSVAEHYDWNSTRSGVMQVGEELARSLRQAGVAVYHDQTINDYPSFGQAYENSRRRLQELIRRYPSIKLVIDIHRDGTNYTARTVSLRGKTAAKVGLVVAGNEYLPNPHWRQNLFFAQKLDAVLREEYPGLSRGIIPRMDARFNQDLLQPALLLEIGTYTNSLAEAKVAAQYVGKALAEVIRSEGW